MRRPILSDYQFVYECYQDWPLAERGPVTLARAIGYTRHWVAHDTEKCLILEIGSSPVIPVGLIQYRQFMTVSVIDNLVVHPNHRLQGHATTIMRELKAILVSEGVVVAEFDALPGPFADKINSGNFFKVSEGVRTHGTGNSTGLPLVTGRILANTVI